MKASILKKEGSTVTLEVEAPATVVEEAYNKAYRQVVNRVNIPGFRKGKAPRHILERFYGAELIKEEAIREVLPKHYLQAVEDTAIEPVDDPEFDDIEFDLGKPLKFTAAVQVRPEVELGDYNDISVAFQAPSVTKEEVDYQFNLLLDRMAELRPLEEGATVEEGNYANCHVKGLGGSDNPLANMDDDLTYIEAGKPVGLLPGLSQALVGMKLGESKQFSAEFSLPKEETPEEPQETAESAEAAEAVDSSDEPAPEAEPAKVEFMVTLNEAYQKHLPEMEEFLKTIGHENDENAKKDLEERILKMRMDTARRLHTDEVEAKLVEMSSVDIPKAMIDHKAQTILERFAARLKDQGTDVDSYMKSSGRTPEDMRTEIEAQAAKEVKSELVLDAVASKEEIEVPEEMVDSVLESLAREANTEVGAMKTTLDVRGALEGLRKDLLRSHTLQKLVAEAASRAGTPLPEEPKPEDTQQEENEKANEATADEQML